MTALTVDDKGVIPATGRIESEPPALEILESLGIIVPLAQPEALRAAFAYKQQMYAAILDEDDYLYAVSYKDGNRMRQYVASSRGEAMERAEALHGTVSAKPKKSGIVKLARALGITAQIKGRRGLPDDPGATHAYVEYEAIHNGTGAKELGVGWCDMSERGGKISAHDVIATADTRAYNRAVLRLSGFGDVSADEIVAGASDGVEVQHVPEPAKAKTLQALPPPNTDLVVEAMKAWGEAKVERAQAGKKEPKQIDSRTIRETRAAARRGDARAANRLGAMGLPWEGPASDGPGYPVFSVEPPKLLTSGGWDLNPHGSDDEPMDGVKTLPDLKAQDGATAPNGKPEESAKTEAARKIPPPLPSADTITTKQAKNVSTLLKQKFGAVEEMRAWLKDMCGVTTSVKIRMNQYESVVKELEGK